MRVIRQPQRLGYRRNFLAAATACTGDLIAFCDQDDVWRKTKLQVMRRLFDDPRVLLAFHEAALIDADGALLSAGDQRGPARQYPPLGLDPFAIVWGFTQLFRRDLLALALLQARSLDPYHPDEPLAHDQLFLTLAGALGWIAYTPERLAAYRQHDANLFGRPHPVVKALHHWRHRARFRAGEAAAAANRVDMLRWIEAQAAPETHPAVPRAIAAYEALAAGSRKGFGGRGDQW